MAQSGIICSSFKGKQLANAEVNEGDQAQCNASCRVWQVRKEVCVFRVPKTIMMCNPEAYLPSIVSLGPYQRKTEDKLSAMDQHKHAMDQHKHEAVHRSMERINEKWDSLIEEIGKFESQIRDCYDEEINLDGQTLSWIIAIDACFILEYFRCAAMIRSSESNQGCFSLVFQNMHNNNCTHFAILNDVMKLENQIPLIILITLLEKEFGSHEDAIEELATWLSQSKPFQGFPFSSSPPEYSKANLKEHFKEKPKHLLDLYRMVIKDLLTPSCPEAASAFEHGGADVNIYMPLPGSPDESNFIHSAELLQKAGIKFEPGQIEFKPGQSSTFSLPEITVEDNTETMLRNLMAYEECQRCSCSPEETVISHFVILLDNLIDSEKDVSVLRKSKVIKSFVGSDKDIACMFNNIGIGITVDYFTKTEQVMKKAREHYDSLWKVWISEFKEEHCSKPWYVVSLVAAILLLVMTAVQTVYTVK